MGARADVQSGENDWLRLCAAGLAVPGGDVIIEDFGLALGAVGPGDGEGDPRSKGLLRHRAPPEAVVDMLAVLNEVLGQS